MKALTFWFDVISPFAYLAFERLPVVLADAAVAVRYQPVLFAGLLDHWGSKGPAELAPKKAWTFRHVAWLAAQHGIAFDLPARHPFNPLPLLRAAWACAPMGGTVERSVCARLFHHVWRGGHAADEPRRLAELIAALPVQRDPAGDEVKHQLRAATDAAIARGVFGVPSFELDGRTFWGVDALPMLAQALTGDAWFDGPAWAAAAALEASAERRR